MAATPPATPRESPPPSEPPAPDAARQRDATESETPPAAPPPSAVSLQLPTLWLRGAFCTLASTVVHMFLFICLALIPLAGRPPEDPPKIVARAIEEPEREPEIPVELDRQVEPADTLETAAAAQVDALGLAGDLPSVAQPQLAMPEQPLYETAQQAVQLGDVNLFQLTPAELTTELPEGSLGNPRAVVDGVDQALDQITQELIWLLQKEEVLVVWLFDQSESMKDEQAEIRQRIGRIYQELGLTTVADGDRLMTAVCSYGQGFAVHTPKPTSKRGDISRAIAQVPIDASGQELMLSGVAQAIARHKGYAQKSRRKMVLILLTDESGSLDENDQLLEPTLQVVREARCRIYVLGRESVFGYPYARIRWKHPQTQRTHWLRINRGPETALVEQLQTDGFRARWDAFPSGFGPYEQSRLAIESDGIFFMLPSQESNLVRGEKRRYELEALRIYKPDLIPRREYLEELNQHEMRRVLAQVIYDLNPYNEQAAKIIVMRVTFSKDWPQLVSQVQQQLPKIPPYRVYLNRAIETVESLEPLRQQEADPRWQANYDLLRAQLYAYQARLYEYEAYLRKFVQKQTFVPPKKGNNVFVHWDLHLSKETLAGEVIDPYVRKATTLYRQVMADHPGSPWAARAKYELGRGFGVKLAPDYEPDVKWSGPLQPIPKL